MAELLDNKTTTLLTVTQASIKYLQTQEKDKLSRRLSVDSDSFLEEVFEWNYKRISDFPYKNFKFENTKQQYSSCEEYQRIMHPLLLLETWQQVVTAKKSKGRIHAVNIDVKDIGSIGEFGVFHTTVSDYSWESSGINNSDLCAIGMNRSGYIGGLPRTFKQFELLDVINYAKVFSVKATKDGYYHVKIKLSFKSKMFKILVPGSKVTLVGLSSLASSEREYTTLFGLQDYNLLKNLMTPKISNISKTVDAGEVSKIRQQYGANQSQAEAIACVTTSSGISLIQGPPGTGKSKTIVSMMKYFFDETNKTKVANFPEILTSKKQILLCAPSNAAIDELVLRLSEETELNLIRLGRKEAVSSKVHHVTLEVIIDLKLSELVSQLFDESKYQQEIQKRDELRDKMEALENSQSDNSKAQEKLGRLKNQLDQCNETLDEMREKKKTKSQVNEKIKEKHEQEKEKERLTALLIKQADIVCTTLSGSAQKQLENLGLFFPTVVIDEACQCTELSSLVPLRYGAKQIIMVGDPNQLPPTVISKVATESNYDESLFSRLAKENSPYLLNIQYRMHPEISNFPSKKFYESKLENGPDMHVINEQPWFKDAIFKPYVFFSVVDGKEAKSPAMSLYNEVEAQFVVNLVDTLLKRYSLEHGEGPHRSEEKKSFKNQIGIVSPYKEQVQLMRKLFIEKFDDGILETVTVQTVDSFQGQEKTIMIFSCVRSSAKPRSIGFLKDYRRLNVALTRGKSNMWIVGNDKTLKKNRLWGSLIKDANERESVVSKAFFEKLKNLNFEDVKKNDNGVSLSNSNFKRADVPTEKAACDDTKDIESYKADCEDSSIRSADGEDELISTVKKSGNRLSSNDSDIKDTNVPIKNAQSDDSKVSESVKETCEDNNSGYGDSKDELRRNLTDLEINKPSSLGKYLLQSFRKFKHFKSTFTQADNKKMETVKM
ncbi:unnamed protein product [Hanseniaspora opuntiae]